MNPFEVLPKPREVQTSSGVHPTPYTVTRGHTGLITGTGDLAAVSNAVDREDIHPVATQNGGAAIGLFVCKFDEASSGPHLELHLGALASPNLGEVISDAPEAFLAAFAARPDWGFLSLALFNDAPDVVALNTEHFGLQAQEMRGSIVVEPAEIRIDLKNVDGLPLAVGRMRRRRYPEIASMWQLARLMGFWKFVRAGRRHWTEADVINRKCDAMPKNRRARTLTSADEMAIMRWISDRDQLELTLPFGFKPLAMQHLNPFRFAYLHPDERICHDE